jgi:hypothetical protein
MRNPLIFLAISKYSELVRWQGKETQTVRNVHHLFGGRTARELCGKKNGDMKEKVVTWPKARVCIHFENNTQSNDNSDKSHRKRDTEN